MNKLPRLIRFLAIIVLVFVALFSFARLAFWQLFDNGADPLTGELVAQSFYIGLKFDLRLALLIILPVLLLGWIRAISPLDSKAGRVLWTFYLTAAGLAALLFYSLDFGYFAYLQTRVDATVLRFLDNLAISTEMVWESYPVVWGALAIGLLAVLLAYGIKQLAARYARVPAPRLRRAPKALVVTGTLAAVLLGIYGKWSWYPLRWSDAFYSPNAFASALALNPVLYFYDSYLNGGIPYDEKAVRNNYSVMAEYLGVDAPDDAKLNYARQCQSDHKLIGTPNVVMVFLESFASYKTGLSGNPLHSTPNFDRIAAEGLYFNNFFTPHTGTARSVFAAVTGIPDVQVGDTSSRNPAIVDQHTIITAFSGYEKFYFLGGSANWRNIRGLLSNNIPGLHIYEEGSYASPRQDVWGISDLDLFKEANQVLREQKAPFFAIIQTAGNHRPYTIPEDNHGFTLKHPEQGQLLRHGFESVEEFNSFRFMDHSVGYFIETARQEGYIDNTVFVFFGDHGISGNAGDHVPKTETRLGIGSHRVPFVIYAPGLIKEPKVLTKVASEVDILPTLAALAAPGDYRNTTFGRDLLDPRYDDRRYAFTIQHQHVPLIGAIGEDFYFRMRADGSSKELLPMNSDAPTVNEIGKHPEVAQRMEKVARGIYETAKYVMNHNPKGRQVRIAEQQ